DVALLENVVQDLLLGLDLRRIALEARPRLGCILQDLADHLAGLLGLAFDAEALWVADWRLQVDVEADPLGGKAALDKPRDAADGAFLVLEVEQRDIAFGRRIELDDVRN